MLLIANLIGMTCLSTLGTNFATSVGTFVVLRIRISGEPVFAITSTLSVTRSPQKVKAEVVVGA